MQLQRLLKLAEGSAALSRSHRLGCYHKKDVPGLVRRPARARTLGRAGPFLGSVAKQCEGSPAIFCYDLIRAGRVRRQTQGRERLGPDSPEPTLSSSYRSIPAAARGTRSPANGSTADQAIRKHDRRHLVLSGSSIWSLDRPGLTSGFVPAKSPRS